MYFYFSLLPYYFLRRVVMEISFILVYGCSKQTEDSYRDSRQDFGFFLVVEGGTNE